MGERSSGKLAARVALAVGAAALIWAATALASTGRITPKDCIGDKGEGTCNVETKGLEGVDDIVVSHDGDSAYGVSFQDSAIVTFKRTSAGKLKPKSCIADKGNNQDNCSKTAKGLSSPVGVAISKDGESVYVAGRDDDAISIFKRDESDGSLKSKGCLADATSNPDGCADDAAGIARPEGLAISSDGDSLYVASYDQHAVSWLKRTGDGSLKPKGCVGLESNNSAGCSETMKGLDNLFAVAVSKNGKSLYAGGDANAVAHMERDRDTGALDPAGCVGDASANTSGCATTFKALDDVEGLAVSADGESVYATGVDSNSVVHFQRDEGNGSLDPIGCFADQGNNPASCGNTALGLDAAEAVTVSPDSQSVYVGGYGDAAVVRFDRDKSDGNLTDKGCVGEKTTTLDACEQLKNVGRPKGLSVSPKGDNLYSAGYTSDFLTRYERSN
jgi:DNA-binding beta-propeller fold protein YncE